MNVGAHQSLALKTNSARSPDNPSRRLSNQHPTSKSMLAAAELA
jgi:hypothetical protein